MTGVPRTPPTGPGHVAFGEGAPGYGRGMGPGGAVIRRIAAVQVGAVAAEVTDPDRSRPVLLVSVSSDTGRPRVDPDVLAEQVGVDVDIVVFADMATAYGWSDTVEDDLRAYGGAIRLVNPAGHADPGGVFLTYLETDPMLTVRRIQRRLNPVVTRPTNRLAHSTATVLSPPPTLRPSGPAPTPNLLRRGAAAPTSPAPAGPAPAGSAIPDPAGLQPLAASPPAEPSGPMSVEPPSSAELTLLQAELDILEARHEAVTAENTQLWEELEQLSGELARRDEQQQDRDDELPRVSKVKLGKVLEVVVEVLTDQIRQRPVRELHRQRTGPGGEDPFLVRDDGAVAWRASLQRKTPQARRLIWWRLPDGSVELARVAAHDDYRMS